MLLAKSVLRLRPASRGHLLLRKSMDLQHAGANEAALRVCEEACNDELVKGEYRVALEARCARLAVPPLRWKKPVFPPRSLAVTRTIHADHPSVECGAIEWYMREAGWSHGVHTENGIWLLLFGVLMADILLPPLPGAPCSTPLVEAPHDFHTPAFFRARQHLITPRLDAIRQRGCTLRDAQPCDSAGTAGCEEEGTGGAASRGGAAAAISKASECEGQGQGDGAPGEESGMEELQRTGDMSGMLARNWQCYYGRLCVGVDWGRFALADLDSLARCVGGCVVARVCSLLAQDYDVWGHGLPDLVFWNPACSSALFVEVKVSLISVLSEKLRRWSGLCIALETLT